MNRYSNHSGGSSGNAWPALALVVLGLFVAGIWSLSQSLGPGGKDDPNTSQAKSAIALTKEAMYVAQTATPAASFWRATEVVVQQTLAPQQAAATAQVQSSQATQAAIANSVRATQIANDTRQNQAEQSDFLTWILIIFLVAAVVGVFILAVLAIWHWLRSNLQENRAKANQARAQLASFTADLVSIETQIKTTTRTLQTMQVAKSQLAWELERQQQSLSRVVKHTQNIEAALRNGQTRLSTTESALQLRQAQLRDAELAHQLKQKALQELDERIAEAQRIVSEPWFQNLVQNKKPHTSINGSGNGHSHTLS